MAVSVENADTYFATNVLHNSQWVEADSATKTRALNNAKAQLYRLYRTFNESTNPVADEAVYEQALWLLRLDETILKAPAGVQMVTVAGITVQVSNSGRYICPEAQMILGRRVGRYGI